MPTHNMEHILCELRSSSTLLVDWGPQWDCRERFTCEPIAQMQREKALGTQEELYTFKDEYHFRHKAGKRTNLLKLARQCYENRITLCKRNLQDKRADMVKQEHYFDKYEASVSQDPDAAELLDIMRGVHLLNVSQLRKRCDDLQLEMARYKELLESICLHK